MIPDLFDRRAHRRFRARAARRGDGIAPLLAEIGERLLERLDDTTHRFGQALLLGGGPWVADRLRSRGMEVVSLDPSTEWVARLPGDRIAGDLEALPIAPGQFDLVAAVGLLHWCNDLPGALVQLRQALRPDGLFLGCVPVLGTLQTLRETLAESEVALTGGASPRISPFPTLHDCASLMQRAGFALPVVDRETMRLAYADPLGLVRDLRAAGESNALTERSRRMPPRALFGMALAALAEGSERLEVTLSLAMLTGWSPAPSQPRPLAPGSGQVPLGEALR